MTSLDKKASAAMQAVALRDHLKAIGPTKVKSRAKHHYRNQLVFFILIPPFILA